MRTIRNIQTAILLGFIILFTSVSAQTDTLGEKKTCDGYMIATYIFEGKVDSSRYFTIKTGEHTYVNFNSYLVEVDKVVKGKIQKGTIEILQPAAGYTYKGPDHWEGGAQSADGQSPPPSKGLYLCFDKAVDMTASNFSNTNAKTLRFYGGIPSINGEIKKDPRGLGISLYFSSLSEFYKYIGANYGIKIDSN